MRFSLPTSVCTLTGRLAVATALTAVVPVALAATAHAGAPTPSSSRLTISAPAGPVASGSRAAVTVRLTTAGAAVAGARVQVLARVNGTWRGVGAVRTDSRGQGRWTGPVNKTLTFRAERAGTPALSRASSGTATVRVAPGVNALGLRALAQARAQIGDPYVYGAVGPNAFDCSGLTGYAYARAGRALPRTSSAQYAATQRISKTAARPGDLIFIAPHGRISHVGIYAGNGRMVAAPKPGDRVKEQAIYADFTVGRVR